MDNLVALIIPVTPIALFGIALAFAYLFGKAFESISRNTESAEVIQRQLLIVTGVIELSVILTVGLTFMVFMKLA